MSCEKMKNQTEHFYFNLFLKNCTCETWIFKKFQIKNIKILMFLKKIKNVNFNYINFKEKLISL